MVGFSFVTSEKTISCCGFGSEATSEIVCRGFNHNGKFSAQGNHWPDLLESGSHDPTPFSGKAGRFGDLFSVTNDCLAGWLLPVSPVSTRESDVRRFLVTVSFPDSLSKAR